MDYKVIISPSAKDDLRECFDYIAHDKPDAALRYCEALIDHAERIGENPEIGRVCPEFDDYSIRDIVFRNHRIIYRIDESKRTIGIARFWHGARGYLPGDFESN